MIRLRQSNHLKIENNPLKKYIKSKWVGNTLDSLSLKEKIGQMVILFTFTNYMTDDSNQYRELLRQVEQNNIGGFMFSHGGVYDAVILANKLQSHSKIPLLITADFERGVAMRLKGGTSFPYNMALGATGDENLAYEMGKAIAIEGRTIGIHQNYAPMVDINNNPKNSVINVRSYGEDPVFVSRLAIAFMNGTHDGGMISTLKHFPGHGDTDIDSHNNQPVLNFNKKRLKEIEFNPFINAIRKGALSVMVTHLVVPSIETEPNLPASLSKSIIEGILKDEIGFKGLITTDALEMKGVSDYFSIEESSVKAIQAGNDMILIPVNPDIAIKSILKAVRKNLISNERINYSVSKILGIKYFLGLHKEKYTNPYDIAQNVGIKSHLELSKKIAQRSITLLKNKRNLIPIQKNNEKKIFCIVFSDEENQYYGNYFVSHLMSKYRNIQYLFLNNEIKAIEEKYIIALAKDSDILLMPVFTKVRAYKGTISLNISQIKIIKTLLSLKLKSIMVSYGNPYLIMEFPNIDTYINTYSDCETSIDAGIESLFGEIDITGKSPINIPGLFDIGYGIEVKSISLFNR
jgi:beta-N-acetylhexosaminidase